MINDANLVNKLIETIKQLPDDIIRDAIRDIIEEDRKEERKGYFGDLVDLVPKYDIKEKYYYENKYNLYVHMNSTSHYGIKEALYTDKEEEVMVA